MNEYSLLNRINGEAELKALNPEQLPLLADELRQYIIKTVAKNGGHLSSNLGTVELTIALHYILNLSEDKLIWDVSHQSYAHKILTGRREFFSTLRQFDGFCGFQTPKESIMDPCFAGHAGTAISTALGVSVGKEQSGEAGLAVAIVGDGSLNCGLSFEGLNNASQAGKRLVIILNDNRMSISANVGAMPSYLHRLITARHYAGLKRRVKRISDYIPGHKWLLKIVRKIEGLTKSALLPGAVFEELGVRYLGPVDGHNIGELCRTLSHVKNSDERPVLIHVITEKGHGYKPAEKDPEAFHGVGSFDIESGKLPTSSKNSFTNAFGCAMLELAKEQPEAVAISAAMTYSTGLAKLQSEFPKRVFDVGIAEGHAVTFAGGLAVGGLRPVVAIYATFIQRALDSVFHDVCLAGLPVVFCLDRAGLVEDGPTHNGIYDLAFFRSMPNMTIMQPCNENELYQMLFFGYQLKSPVVIRYPRGGSGQEFTNGSNVEAISLGKAQLVKDGSDLAIWALGVEVNTALEVAELLTAKGFSIAVVNARFVKPLDRELLAAQAQRMPIITIEDHDISGGLGSAVAEALPKNSCGMLRFGWPSEVLPHGKPAKLREKCGLLSPQIAESVASFMKKDY